MFTLTNKLSAGVVCSKPGYLNYGLTPNFKQIFQELTHKLKNIFLINLALIDGSFLFSAFKRKGYIETRCPDNCGDPGKIFDIPPTQCEGTHFKLIHTASVILI